MAATEQKTRCIDDLVSAIEEATIDTLDTAFAPDVVLDATVPNWRFTVRGADGVRRELAGWYGHPGRFEELERTPLEDGELVAFLLTWTEDGVPHACHQVHRLRVAQGRIASDTVWCGGRWPESLMAEMAAAAKA